MLTHAGEVGDGPDQGHSDGADSVPPAPNLSTNQFGGLVVVTNHRGERDHPIKQKLETYTTFR